MIMNLKLRTRKHYSSLFHWIVVDTRPHLEGQDVPKNLRNYYYYYYARRQHITCTHIKKHHKLKSRIHKNRDYRTNTQRIK